MNRGYDCPFCEKVDWIDFPQGSIRTVKDMTDHIYDVHQCLTHRDLCEFIAKMILNQNILYEELESK